MVRRGTLVLVAALLASSCATQPDAAPLPERLPGVALVSWEATSLGPFCRGCEWVKVVAAADGRVWIRTSRWARNEEDWLVSTRLVTVSPDRFEAFSNQLSTVRPSGDLLFDSNTCENGVPDQGEVTILWTDDQRSDRLVYDFGCERFDIAVAIRDAPELLGIRDLNYSGRPRRR